MMKEKWKRTIEKRWLNVMVSDMELVNVNEEGKGNKVKT